MKALLIRAGVLLFLLIACYAASGRPPASHTTRAHALIPASACMDDTWNAVAPFSTTSGGGPGVWTGYEMIIGGGPNPANVYLPAARYNPRTNTWTAASTSNAPAMLVRYSAVWTGKELIIWGGYKSTTPQLTGARYNPNTDTWTATSTVNAPAARAGHSAIWTGSEMIVWGGATAVDSYTNTGGRYNPVTDSWSPITVTGAPTARDISTAIWTGTEMIVWGGSPATNTGGRYNPQTDSWTATTVVNAPSARSSHTAVWTGTEMIIWGGGAGLADGGRYNPLTDSWVATSIGPLGRVRHSAIWTGMEMIVWGGINASQAINSGGRYNPASDSWTQVTMTAAPGPRYDQVALWTGSKMIIWGGNFLAGRNNFPYNDGGTYCVRNPLSLSNAVSVGTHGSNHFDVGLPVSGTIPIEARASDGSGNSYHTFALTFSNPVVSVDSQATSCGSVTATSTFDSTYYVQFDGSSCDGQYVTVTLSGVHDVYNNTLPSASATIGLLAGDTNGDGIVNAADAQQTRNRSGQSTDGNNFRADVNLDGAINSADATMVRARSGNSLPPAMIQNGR